MRILLNFIIFCFFTSIASFAMNQESKNKTFIPLDDFNNAWVCKVHNHKEACERLKELCEGETGFFLTKEEKENTILIHDLDCTHVHDPSIKYRILMPDNAQELIIFNLLHFIAGHDSLFQKNVAPERTKEWQAFLKKECRHNFGIDSFTSPIDLDGSNQIATYASEHGIPQMIVTRTQCGRLRNYETIHKQELFKDEQGIDFSEEIHVKARQNSKITFPESDKTCFKHMEEEHLVCYQNNNYGPCLMLSSQFSKGDTLDSLWFHFKVLPKVVIVYDDNCEQLVSIVKALEKKGIKTICLFNNYSIGNDEHLNSFINRIFPSNKKVLSFVGEDSPYCPEMRFISKEINKIDMMLSTYCEEDSNSEGTCPTHGVNCFREENLVYWIKKTNPQFYQQF